MTEPRDQARIHAALAAVWTRTRPVLLERTAAVSAAVEELSRPAPDDETVARGRQEAHKLAGVLGTFGLDRGTDLARELEERLGSASGAGEAAELSALSEELCALVEGAVAEPSA